MPSWSAARPSSTPCTAPPAAPARAGCGSPWWPARPAPASPPCWTGCARELVAGGLAGAARPLPGGRRRTAGLGLDRGAAGARRRGGSRPARRGAGPAAGGLRPPASTPTRAFGRFRLHRAVGDWLAVATDRPLAVVLDDLHRADEETLALLRSVADQLQRAGEVDAAGGVPVLLVAAYRPNEVGEPLDDTLAALARHGPVRLTPTGLDAAQAARLVRRVAGVQPDPAVVAALTERTGGNPFYLRESARLLASEGELVATSRGPGGRARRAAAPVRAAARGVGGGAAAGRRDRSGGRRRRAGAGRRGRRGAGARRAGRRHGRRPAAGARARGRSGSRTPWSARCSTADLSRLRRGRLHARVAAALEQLRPGDLSALAHHYARAASPATADRAVDYAVRAAEQATGRFAYEAAAGLYRQALAGLDLLEAGGPREEQRVDLFVRLIRTQLQAGASAAAGRTRELAVDVAERSGRHELMVRRAGLLGRADAVADPPLRAGERPGGGPPRPAAGAAGPDRRRALPAALRAGPGDQ